MANPAWEFNTRLAASETNTFVTAPIRLFKSIKSERYATLLSDDRQFTEPLKKNIFRYTDEQNMFYS